MKLIAYLALAPKYVVMDIETIYLLITNVMMEIESMAMGALKVARFKVDSIVN